MDEERDRSRDLWDLYEEEGPGTGDEYIWPECGSGDEDDA